MKDTLPIIRIADTADIPTIGALAEAIWPDTYSSILSNNQIRYMLELFYSPESLLRQFQDGHLFLILTKNTENVGFASYAKFSENGTYQIHKLYIHPLQQGKGFGNILLDAIRQHVLHQRGNKIRLNVNRHNKALSFYERYGFKEVSEEDIPIGNGYFMNDYVMEMEL